MKKYVVFDPSYVTDNLGDFIILDAVNAILREVFPRDYMFHVPTNDRMGPEARAQVSQADLSFVGGTNILTSHWWWYRQWNLTYTDLFRVRNAVLLGVGWHKYQNKPDLITGLIYKSILSSKYLHSVRDKYTEDHLRSIGIQNVLYTGCPTMWGLTPELCSTIPQSKSNVAVVTLTAYLANQDADRRWLDLVFKSYEKVYFWSQMHDDHDYAVQICGDRLNYISPSLEAYNDFLESCDCDFIGTRLHGGVRALQKRRRSLILEVDNRAKEIGKTTGLKTVPREDLSAIGGWISGSVPTLVSMPVDNIAKWKRQFE